MAPEITTLRKGVRNWWLFLLVGILFIAVGIITLLNPLSSYLTLAIFFGWLLFISGIVRIAFAVSNRDKLEGWGWALAVGILDTILGIVLFFHPELSMLVLAFVVGFSILLSGASLISYAIELQKIGVKGWGWLTFGGVLVSILGVLLIFNPLIGAITLVGWTGFAFLAAGIFYIAFSLQVRRVKKRLEDLV